VDFRTIKLVLENERDTSATTSVKTTINALLTLFDRSARTMCHLGKRLNAVIPVVAINSMTIKTVANVPVYIDQDDVRYYRLVHAGQLVPNAKYGTIVTTWDGSQFVVVNIETVPDPVTRFAGLELPASAVFMSATTEPYWSIQLGKIWFTTEPI